MSSIIDIKGREILDSRGFPTIEVEVLLASGVMARAAVPSGASTGKYEAIELRDGNKKRYNGKGVLKAVNNVNNIICPQLLDFDILNQKAIDEQLIKTDGSPNKSVLGANAILGVSLACAKAASRHLGIPFHRYIGGQYANILPMPMANIINGGSHADGNVDIQEFMIVPIEAKNFKEAVRIISEIFHTLKALLKKNGYSTSVGDEGGYAPSLKNNEEAIELILQAAKTAKHKVKIALDAAASELVNNAKKKNTYCFWKSTGKTLSSDQMVNYWVKLVAKYPEIISIEDPMGEDDWDGWAKLTKALKGKNVQIVGDDLFVTNPKFLEKGIKKDIANAVLVKVNQIGTLSETIEVIKMAHKNGYATVVSHRSGETEDTTIADLAIATSAGQIKTGSVSRSERVAKYNQLIRLEEQLGKLGHFDLKNSFPGIKF